MRSNSVLRFCDAVLNGLRPFPAREAEIVKLRPEGGVIALKYRKVFDDGLGDVALDGHNRLTGEVEETVDGAGHRFECWRKIAERYPGFIETVVVFQRFNGGIPAH